MNKPVAAILIAGLWLGTMTPASWAQAVSVDCSTPEGQLALMFGSVLTGPPFNPLSYPHDPNLVYSGSGTVFKEPVEEESIKPCMEFLEYRLFTSLDPSRLQQLPALAQRDDNWTPPRGVSGAPVSIRRGGNRLDLRAQQSRSLYPEGNVSFRFGRRIKKEGGVDPWMWSEIFNFDVPVLPNLLPVPSAASGRNRPLFAVSGGSFGIEGESFLRVPEQFCAAVVNDKFRLADYPCSFAGAKGDTGSKDSKESDPNAKEGEDEPKGPQCRRFSMTAELGPVVFGVTNRGQAVASGFPVQLLRQEVISGNPTRLEAVANQTVQTLNPGAEQVFTFDPRRAVTVFVFEDENPGLCFAQCDPRLPGCTLEYQELAYVVRVDGGNNATGGGSVLETNERDNEGNPMGNN